MERQEPVHRLGGRRPVGEGHRGGEARRSAPRGGRRPARRRAHLAPAPRHHDGEPRARRGRPPLDPREAVLAPQRAALRCAPGQEQEADARGVRRGAVHALAPLLRRPAARDRARLRVLAGHGPALRRRPRRAHRVPQGRARARPAVLGRRGRPRPQGGQDRPGRRARQLAARDRQAPRRHLRRGHRRAQHPDRHPAALRARRGPQARHEGRPLPRPRGRRRGRRGGRAPRPRTAPTPRTTVARPEIRTGHCRLRRSSGCSRRWVRRSRAWCPPGRRGRRRTRRSRGTSRAWRSTPRGRRSARSSGPRA